jgi:hypothetical protein
MRRRSKLDDGGSSDKKYPYQPRRRSPVAVVICAILAAVASVIGIAIWRWTVGPGGIPVPTYLGRHPSAAATAQALGLLRTASLHGNCVTVRHDQLRLLPTPYQRCAYGPRSPEVDYLVQWTDSSADTSDVFAGFIFSPAPGLPDVPDSCVRHVVGSWWANMSEATPEQPCASSFTFVPAP